MHTGSSATALVSVVVPVFNEAGNLRNLVNRVEAAFAPLQIPYQLIVIDDNSSDHSWSILKDLELHFPLKAFKKQGQRGKASSLVEGFSQVDSRFVAMLDGDLQYPPEELPAMLAAVQGGDSDVVVGKRIQAETSLLRRILSSGFRIVFCRWLWGFTVDVQSGMKVFHSKLLDRVAVDTKPWTFDLEFLVSARSAGYSIAEHNITFAERTSGETKINALSASYQLGKEAVLLRIRTARGKSHPVRNLNGTIASSKSPK